MSVHRKCSVYWFCSDTNSVSGGLRTSVDVNIELDNPLELWIRGKFASGCSYREPSLELNAVNRTRPEPFIIVPTLTVAGILMLLTSYNMVSVIGTVGRKTNLHTLEPAEINCRNTKWQQYICYWRKNIYATLESWQKSSRDDLRVHNIPKLWHCIVLWDYNLRNFCPAARKRGDERS